MTTTVQFFQPFSAEKDSSATMVLGHLETLKKVSIESFLPPGARDWWEQIVEELSPNDSTDVVQMWLPGKPGHKLVVGALPITCSRHNSPVHPHAITSLIADNIPNEEAVNLVIALDRTEDVLAVSCAVARSFPLYSSKSEPNEASVVHVHLLTSEGLIEDGELAQQAANAVRRTASLVDQPTSELNTDAFVAEAESLAKELGLECNVIRGQELKEQGFGGLWNVGRASDHPPALVVLTYEPKSPTRTVVWVGKGVVYDTGGLSIKPKTGMPGMKSDMAGAAAVLAAFGAAARTGFPDRLHAILCLAENSVGSNAFRPDDILTMYSGKTVEVNNTDAEGRLVLADGVAYAVKHLSPDILVDMATLTGAQLVSTGRKHAGIMSNDQEWEEKACHAGRISGDLVHPLPYCPEFFKTEFKSSVADMKNSVKDRMNAQSSCAGQFIGEHLGSYQNPWLHIDIAGPSTHQERGTGFGVALLLTLFSNL